MGFGKIRAKSVKIGKNRTWSENIKYLPENIGYTFIIVILW